ncbi:MAG TPA: alpha/beta fold hydrolase [Kofleriaceae bacterium]|nr:alpha/beta fold hydrolase [Kofleriaceae bacterium]
MSPPSAVADVRARLLAGLPVSDRRIEVAGITTAVVEGGDGPPLVLLHGANASAVMWLRVLPDLVERYRIIAPDLPGHGATDAHATSLGAERVLAWLDELIAKTCPEPPLVVGNTLGGAIAARFAIAHPERVRRLVLVDPLGLETFVPRPEFGMALGAFVADPSPETYDRLWQQCAFDVEPLRASLGARWKQLETYSLAGARDPRLVAVQQSLMGAFVMTPIPERELAALRVPTALIWGRGDRAIAVSVGEAASARYGWPLDVIDAAGDAAPLEQPADFARALRRADRDRV